MSSLRLPLVFFTENPPILSYTTCYITRNRTRMITGSNGGLCVLWCLTSEIDDTGKEEVHAEPFAVLHGHETTVVDVCEVVHDFSPSACTVSMDGSIFVWNLSDGRCLALSPYIFQSAPHSIVTLPYRSKGNNIEMHLVACAGKSNNIEILDLRQMKIVKVLEGHTEWVRSLACNWMDAIDMNKLIMLSVSDDLTIRYWTFEYPAERNYIKENDSILSNMNSFSVQTLYDNILTVSHASDLSYVLIVFQDRWVVYAYQDYMTLFEVEAVDPAKPLKGGLFIDRRHVLIYNNAGEAYVYRLPSQRSTRSILKAQSGQEKRKTLSFQNQETFQTMMSPRKPVPEIKKENVPSASNFKKSTSFYNSFMTVLGVKTTKQMQEEQEHEKSKMENLISSGIRQIEQQEQILANINKAAASSASPSLAAAENVIVNSRSMGSLRKVAWALSNENIALSSQIEKAMTGSIADGPSIQISRITRSDSLEDSDLKMKARPTLMHVIKEEEQQMNGNSSAPSTNSLASYSWKYEGGLLVRSDTNGKLMVWSIGFVKDSSIIGEEGEEEGERLLLHLSSDISLVTGWPFEQSNQKRITASHFCIENEYVPVLVHGYSNGVISVIPGVASSGDKKLKHFEIDAHADRVTTVLVMTDDDNYRQVLLSGSSDYSVKMWNLDWTFEFLPPERRLLATYHFHSAPVNLIFLPPKPIRKKLQNCFCSVGEDRSVVLYSVKTMESIHVLGGHQSSVTAVYWQPDLDYLYVRCSDSAMYIWQLSTGLMERRLSGKIAQELIERCEGPGSTRKRSVKISFSKQSAFAYEKSSNFFEGISLSVEQHMSYSDENLSNMESPDLQLLMLSVRRLTGYIASKAALMEQYFVKQQQKVKSSSTKDFEEHTSATKSVHISGSVTTDNLKSTLDALTHLPYSLVCALSYILQYGNEGNCAALQSLRSKLEISEDFLTRIPKAYIGLKGVGNTFSLIVPKASDRSHPFLFSPVLSALHAISVIAVLNALSSIPSLQDLCHQCIRYYLYDMPKEFERYEDPSFLWCATFLKDSSVDIQNAARSVMGAVLQRMPLEQQKILAEKLSYNYLQPQSETMKQNTLVALSILAYKVPKAVDKRVFNIVSLGLVEIAEKGGAQQNTALTLLGDGYHLWQQFLPEPAALMRSMFDKSKAALTSPTSDAFKSSESSIASDALKAFVNMASVDTKLYIDLLNSYIMNAQQTSTEILSAIITSLYPLTKKFPECLVNHLVIVMSLLLKVLDPHFPNIRNSCMTSSTNVLKYQLEVFPMISYHQEKQKLAVGGPDGVVVIYDMRTASKWQLFDAHHKKPVTLVSFSPTGDYLATFSIKDASCKIWSVDGTGVLSLLGLASRSQKTFDINITKPNLTNEEILKFVKLDWDGNKKLVLRPGDNQRLQLSF